MFFRWKNIPEEWKSYFTLRLPAWNPVVAIIRWGWARGSTLVWFLPCFESCCLCSLQNYPVFHNLLHPLSDWSRRFLWGPGECWLRGNPMIKGSVEIQSYRGTKMSCLVTESHSERDKNFALSLSFWIFQIISVHFFALLRRWRWKEGLARR